MVGFSAIFLSVMFVCFVKIYAEDKAPVDMSSGDIKVMTSSGGDNADSRASVNVVTEAGDQARKSSVDISEDPAGVNAGDEKITADTSDSDAKAAAQGISD